MIAINHVHSTVLEAGLLVQVPQQLQRGCVFKKQCIQRRIRNTFTNADSTCGCQELLAPVFIPPRS